MKKLVILFSIMIFSMLLSPAFAYYKDFSLSNERYIDTGSNSDWYYLRIGKVDKTELIGISRTDRGAIGIGQLDKNGVEMYGKMWMVGAFKHPANSKWYLCPVRNMDMVNEIVDLDNGWYFDVSDSSATCYRYDDTSITGNADLDVKASFVANVVGSSVKTKINVNMTINGVSPSDTGFGFLFIPENPQRYRYVYINNRWIDLSDVEGPVPVQKVFRFFKSDYSSLGHVFDWTDMMDTGKRFSQIVSFGPKKGLFVGTYGYGASNLISIDPIYQVDYSPTPGEFLFSGNSLADKDTFVNVTDISVGISDNDDLTAYSVCDYYISQDYEFFKVSLPVITDKTSDVLVAEGTHTDIKTNFPSKYALLNTTNLVYDGDVITLRVTSHDSASENQMVYLRDSTANITYGNFTLGLQSVWVWRNVTLNLPAPTNLFYFVDNGTVTFDVQPGYDYISFKSYQCNAFDTKWAELYDENYNWFLRVRKTTPGTETLFVYSYQDNNSVNVSQNVSKSLAGVGWFNIPVDELMNYSTPVLNHTQFRIFLEVKGQNISEIVLRQEANDTAPPVLVNNSCWINNTLLFRGDVTRLSCNVTDDVDVEFVNMTVGKLLANGSNINITDYATMKYEDTYYVDFTCTRQSDGLFNWSHVKYYDIVGNGAVEQLDFFYECKDSLATITVTESPEYCITELCEVCVNISDDESDPYNIVDVEWALSSPNDIEFQILEEEIIEHYHNETSPDGVVHCFNVSSWELGKFAYPGTRIKVTIQEEDDNTFVIGYSNYFLVDNTCPCDLDLQPGGICECAFCISIWEENFGACYANNTQMKYYFDAGYCNSTKYLPPDNGSFVWCDYCDADIIGPFYDPDQCTSGNQTRYYLDLNYDVCCAVTGLFSDCDLDYVFVNGTSECQVLRDDVELLATSSPIIKKIDAIKDKIDFIAKINISNSTKCWSYVKKDDKILQTNPQRVSYAESLLSRKKEEDREYFTPVEGVINAYYTDENLLPMETFILGMRCALDDGRVVSGEQYIIPTYDDLRRVTARSIWGASEVPAMILIVVLSLLVVGLLIYAWKK